MVSSGGWWKELCVWNGLLNITGAGGIFAALIQIATERYLSICIGRPIPIFYAWTSFAFSSLFSIGVGAYAIITFETSLQLVSNNGYCIIAHHSHSQAPFILSIISIFTIVLASTILPFCYASVFFKYYFRKKKAPQTSKSWPEISASESIVLRKCLTLSFSFLILWGFELICIIVEFITERPLSPTYYSLSSLFACLHTLLDPFFITYFDAKLRFDIYDLLGVSNTPTMAKIEYVIESLHVSLPGESLNSQIYSGKFQVTRPSGSVRQSGIGATRLSEEAPKPKHRQSLSTVRVPKTKY